MRSAIRTRTLGILGLAAGLLFSALVAGPKHAQAGFVPPHDVKRLVQETFPDAPIMVRVAKCESNLMHRKPDGKLVRSPKNAIGIMQIHVPAHSNDAKARGIDITTPEGNLAWARILFNREGLRPWKSSRSCWSNK